MKLTNAALVTIAVGGTFCLICDALDTSVSTVDVVGHLFGLLIGTIGCASIAANRGRSDWTALWGLFGLFGWAGVAIFLRKKQS